MNFFERIASTPLTASEESVVDYIKENTDSIFKMTTHDLASVSNTSSATIVRLCKKLKYSSFEDFKIHLFNDYKNKSISTVDPNLPILVSDNSLEVAQKTKQLYVDAVSETFSHLNLDTISSASEVINRSETTFLFGNLNNELYIKDLQLKFEKIGKRSISSFAAGGQLLNAANANQNDCAIIVSYTGHTEELRQIALILKSKNVPIITITSDINSVLAKLSSITILLPHSEVLYPKIGSFSSKISINYILDLLFLVVFNLDYDRNISNYHSYSSHLSKVNAKMKKAYNTKE